MCQDGSGACLLGADLGASAGGSVEGGGLKPCIDMHGGMGGSHLLGKSMFSRLSLPIASNACTNTSSPL